MDAYSYLLTLFKVQMIGMSNSIKRLELNLVKEVINLAILG